MRTYDITIKSHEIRRTYRKMRKMSKKKYIKNKYEIPKPQDMKQQTHL